MGFADSGWKISNGVVTYPATLDPWIAYRFIIESIYDGHLPVTRIIGYAYRTDSLKKMVTGRSMLERNKDCLDDKMTIVSNLSKILLLNYSGTRVATSAVDGVMKVSSMDFMYSKKKIEVLSTTDYILRSSTVATLDLAVNKCTGYRDAQYNYNKIKSSSKTTSNTRYLPMFSYHNIIDYVNVLPPVNGQIRLMYNFGMTDEYLTAMFEDMFTLRPDTVWCSNYAEVFK